jgi:2-hydroxychromene-2-carboxylate isomerase
MTLRCYFSFRSPFAAIAIYRLRRLRAFSDVDIELMPVWPEIIFGGHIDNPSDNLFKMAYIFGDAARQAEMAGLDRTPFDRLAGVFTLPEGVDYTREKIGVPMGEEHWERTHKAFLYAQDQGKGWSFADAVFIRRFNFDGAGNADVMNPEIIAEIAEQAGLDREATLSAIGDPEYGRQIDAVIERGNKDGVFGVPFFVLESEEGTEKYWGNDRLEYVLMKLRGADSLPSLPKVSMTETCRD